MNKHILDSEVQDYISSQLSANVHEIAMAKSPFQEVAPKELANQIAAKNKSAKKLPTWYNHDLIYYPPPLSIEQCSSETTAIYKSHIALDGHLIDLTGGFGVDAYYFAKAVTKVTHCEINKELSEIAAYNAGVLKQNNIQFLATDGLAYLHSCSEIFDTVYIDPGRRSASGKVFMLRDCTPDVTIHLDLLLSRSRRIIVKTAPLLDITAGLKELRNVSEVHILSIKNECRELLWVIDKDIQTNHKPKIIAVAINESVKAFTFYKDDENLAEANLSSSLRINPEMYLYEPDAALLKSGAFNLIASSYGLKKLHSQTQLYTSNAVNSAFPGRIFRICKIISSGDLKKEKDLAANIVVRNYRDKPELLTKKYKIRSGHNRFLIFTQSKADGFIIIDADIMQHY